MLMLLLRWARRIARRRDVKAARATGFSMNAI
jgi:hypothetical protein